MTIDERLDRLTERHEALAQSVEILVSAQRENAGQLALLTQHMLIVSQLLRSHENRLGKLEG